MRIAFFTDTYLPARSGMEISIESFRAELEKMGHELFVYTPTMRGYQDLNKNVTRFTSMRVIRRPEMRLAFPWGAVDSSIRTIADTPFNVVHAHSPFTMGFLGRYVARKQGIPLVFTNHCHHTEYAKIYFREKYLLPYTTEKFIRWFANQCDRVIAPSTKFKELMEMYGVTRPIDIVQTGIDTSLFTPSEERRAAAQELRKKHDIPRDAPVLVYVGRMSDEKNVRYLIEALALIQKELPDVHMFFIGDGKSRERYAEEAEKLGIKHAIFTGALPHEELPAYYHASQAFLFASLTDTQGIVILEALASGLPVVALRDSALIDVLKHQDNSVLVDVRAAPEVFASEVCKLLSEGEHPRMSARAVETAAHYTERLMAEKLATIYEGLVMAKKLEEERETTAH